LSSPARIGVGLGDTREELEGDRLRLAREDRKTDHQRGEHRARDRGGEELSVRSRE
jgi:hypothetical protein